MPDATRRELLVAGTGAAAAAAVMLTPAAALAAGSVTQPAVASETDRLQRLLRVELLMLYGYQSVLGTPVLRPPAQRALAALRLDEEAHIRALTDQLRKRGGTVPPAPASVAAADKDLARRNVAGRLGQLRGADDALGLLLALERVVVGAYFVALIKLQDPELIVLAAEVMANDAQHQAMLGEQLHHGNAAMSVPYALVQGAQGH